MNFDPTGILADTDVVSFIFNNDPVRCALYLAHLRGKRLFISFITAGEVRYGALLRDWGEKRRARLEEYLAEYEVVESSPEICAVWARIRLAALRSGRAIERQDAWIAATAICSGLTLVTHNAAHFAGVQLLRVVTEPDSQS